METIIGVLIAGLGASVVWGIKRLGAHLFLKKYGPTVGKVFDVIDPIAGDLMTAYDGSTLQEALKLAVDRVSDGKICEEDVLEISKYVIAKFDPSLAASKNLEPSSSEAAASRELMDAVVKLRSGVSADSLRHIMQIAPKLI